MRALLGALLLAGCAGLTHARLPVWRSDETLWFDAHQQSPTQTRPLLNLGAAAIRRGDVAAAERWWAQAESTGRLTATEQQALRAMRCRAAILYGDPARPLGDCF